MTEPVDPNTIEEVHPPEELLALFVELDSTGLSIEEIENFADTMEALSGDFD